MSSNQPTRIRAILHTRTTRNDRNGNSYTVSEVWAPSLGRNTILRFAAHSAGNALHAVAKAFDTRTVLHIETGNLLVKSVRKLVAGLPDESDPQVAMALIAMAAAEVM